ncbi:MAG: hypothetical protein RMA76_19845 [Deltaproteobacteria bacterium]
MRTSDVKIRRSPVGAPAANEVRLRPTDKRSVPFAPLGVYAEERPRVVHTAPTTVRPGFTAERPRQELLRQVFDDIVLGAPSDISEADLRGLQALALDTIHRTFDDKYGNDTFLREQVGKKLDSFADARFDEAFARSILAGRKLSDKQCDALAFVLRTFLDSSDSDSLLRRAAIMKLGEIGRRRDVGAILPHVRKGDSSDLHHGLGAIRSITKRRGSPQTRKRLRDHPVVGPLLKKGELTTDEHQLLVEMVLKHGTIDRVDEMKGGAHFNPVFFVTFKETEPAPGGKRRPIRGVFKPETTWPGKDRSYFAREVSAYEFDRTFARTGLVPPTVEGLLPLGRGPSCELGSLQYMIPDAEPLGYRIREQGVEKWKYQPAFEHLKKDPAFLRQMNRARTILYVLGDPDKLPSNVKPLPNLANFMVSGGNRLWLIDNAYSQGAAPKPHREILPRRHDGTVLREFETSLAHGRSGIEEALSTFIESTDASEVSRRTDVARQLLRDRPRDDS